jgi:hypothetical protein
MKTALLTMALIAAVAALSVGIATSRPRAYEKDFDSRVVRTIQDAPVEVLEAHSYPDYFHKDVMLLNAGRKRVRSIQFGVLLYPELPHSSGAETTSGRDAGTAAGQDAEPTKPKQKLLIRSERFAIAIDPGQQVLAPFGGFSVQQLEASAGVFSEHHVTAELVLVSIEFADGSYWRLQR